MSGSISIPIWVIGCLAFLGALTWLILTHGRKPFAEDKKPFDHLMEVVGKPYVLFVFVIAAALLISAYIFYLNDIIFSVHDMVKRLRIDAANDQVETENLKNLAQGSALLLGALVAASTLIFTLIRTWVNERTTTATEEGLITDRINAAVASLGAEKTKKDFETEKEYTAPNIEVRMGAILALERIAKMNADFHIQIMEILTGYIRENAPRPKDILKPKGRQKPRHDIQLALTVIGRRPAKRIALERASDYRLGLIDCDFTSVNLSGLNFDHADLIDSDLSDTNLLGASLYNAILWGASLNDALCWHATLNNADLMNASLNNAELVDAKLEDVKDLMQASLRGACVKNLDFTKIGATQEQINTMFGDASVTLPASLTRPDHWPNEVLDHDDFYAQWHAWKKTLPPQG